MKIKTSIVYTFLENICKFDFLRSLIPIILIINSFLLYNKLYIFAILVNTFMFLLFLFLSYQMKQSLIIRENNIVIVDYKDSELYSFTLNKVEDININENKFNKITNTYNIEILLKNNAKYDIRGVKKDYLSDIKKIIVSNELAK